MRASSPANDTARSVAPRATGATAAPIMGASDESGPSTMTRDGPKAAYASSAATVAFNPVIGGSPDTSA